MANDFLFTSESVSEGHPDKLADQTFLTDQPCAAPCWHGLELGSSTKGAALSLLPVLIFGVGVAVVLVAGALTIGATLSSIFRVVLYRFATNGQVVQPFDDSDVRNAFRPKRAGRIAI